MPRETMMTLALAIIVLTCGAAFYGISIAARRWTKGISNHPFSD